MESFDPFSEWLGRPPGRPPEDHYELLGLARFEPDLDLISHAADMLRTKLRKVRPGAHVAEWQGLLDRLEAAKNCLADPIGKAAYDESIDTASHTLNVSGEPVVTWDSPAESLVGAGSGEVSSTADAEIVDTDEAASGAPSFVEAPPVVGDLGQGDPLEGRQDSPEATFPAIQPLIGKRERARFAVQILLICVVLLSVAIGLAVFKQWREASQGVATSPQGPRTTSPIDAPGTDPNGNLPPVESPREAPADVPAPGNISEPPSSPSPIDPPPPSVPDLASASRRVPPATPASPPLTAAVDPAKQAAFRQAVTSARAALAARDLEAAATQLNEAVSLAQTEQDRAEAGQIEVLRAHVEAFWGSLEAQIPRLESASELQVGEVIVLVVETGADYVVLRVSGRNHRYSIEGMPHVLAAAMAEALFSKSHHAKALRAAFLISEPEGDGAQARQLLQEASQGGVEVDELLSELNRS